jgi:hypothetical protein
MRTNYHARWISKARRNALLKSGDVLKCVLLDSFNGFIIVEPVGSDLGDGEVLSTDDADYELRDAWCQESRAKLTQARKLLQLDDILNVEQAGVG